MNTDSDWLQITADVDPERLDAWETALLEVGALSITYRDAHDNPVFEPGPGEIALWESLRITALFPQGSERAEVLGRLTARLDGIDPDAVESEQLPDRHWERAWLDDFAPMNFGDRLWICPLDVEPPAPQAVNLRLDPGLAFGTGTHPTTSLCLRWLDGHDVEGATVVDYGCGSGVLGIAALLLGAREVHATDIDPQALQATRDNAGVNQVAGRLRCSLPEELATVRADVVMANILAGPLVELAPVLTALCERGGYLVLSGLLGEQADAVIEAYQSAFDSFERADQGEWCRISARRSELA